MNQRRIILTLLICFTVGSLIAQNYKDQMALIRLKPDYSMVFGHITDYTGEKLSSASVSVFNPASLSLTETIPVDDLGDYLFTLEKGRTLGFLVEKEGYFPYYSEFTIPEDAEDLFEYPMQLPDGIRKEYTLIFRPDGYLPSNSSIVEEMISLLLNQPELSLWMPDQENPLGKSRIVFLDSLIQSRGIEEYRLISGSLPGKQDQIVELSFETDPDAEIPDQWSDSEPQTYGNDEKWTLQFSASKSKLTERGLKGLKDYKVFEGKDGFYRYTYGAFNTRQEANNSIMLLRDQGFNQAFPKLIGNLKKL